MSAWSNAGMPSGDSHRELIRRWLHGETINGHVGVRLHGGPSNGRTKVVQVGDRERPPDRLRVRRGGGSWHLYLLAADPAQESAWIYHYGGETDGP
jgi:hypothetical protein